MDVALAVGAHGVHVGQDDIPAKAARQLLGPDKILGVSVKTVQQALQAAADGADYLGSGASKRAVSSFNITAAMGFCALLLHGSLSITLTAMLTTAWSHFCELG